MYIAANLFEPGIERVQALADISRSALCCQQQNRTPIANPPNNAQLEGTPTIPPRYIPVRQCENAARDRQTHRHTDRPGQ